MKSVLVLTFLGASFLTSAQIKINVNGRNINLNGKGSNSNSNNGTTTPEQNNANTNTNTNTNSNSNYEFNRNPDAPEGVNNHLAAGDFCVVIGHLRGVSRKRVYQVVDGGYGIIDANATDWDIRNNANAIKYYAANSVYPDVDFTKFSTEMRQYEEYIKHYIKCYSQNHLPSIEVSTNWSPRWPGYYLGSVKEANEHLFKLKSLDSLFKLNYANLPNFYCRYEDNPYIWGQIAAKRDSMVSCLLSSSGDGQYGEQLKRMTSTFIQGISDLKNYSPDGEWPITKELTEISISMEKRKEWAVSMESFFSDYAAFTKLVGKDPNVAQDTMNELFDLLNAEMKIALPKYKPENKIFQFRDAGLEAKMKAYLKNPSSLTIYKIGLTHDTWQIAKNEYGIPDYKYKYGAMYVKNPSWDHSYCKVLYFTLKQDYAGGGTYGESRVGNYYEDYFGCP